MQIFGLSDTGLVREINEDIALFEAKEEGQAIFVVCDGMGGAQAGNVASEIASKIFLEHLGGNIRQSMSVKYMESIMRNAVSFSNYATYRMASSSSNYRGMGTTLVGGFINGDSVMLSNVGDSRAYISDPEGLTQITRDHSLVEELLRRGEITEEEARDHPRRNLITRVIGTDTKVTADLYTLTLTAGQKLMLCSDGLTGMLRDDEIQEILRADDGLEQICQKLVSAANERGGHDNISVLVITL